MQHMKYQEVTVSYERSWRGAGRAGGGVRGRIGGDGFFERGGKGRHRCVANGTVSHQSFTAYARSPTISSSKFVICIFRREFLLRRLFSYRISMLKSRLSSLSSLFFGAPIIARTYNGATLETAQSSQSRLMSSATGVEKAYFANGW